MATLQQCQSYAATYTGVPLSQFYLDHDGSTAHINMYSSMYWYPDSQGMIGFPWNGIIGGANAEYVYADGPGPGTDPTNFLDTYLP